MDFIVNLERPFHRHCGSERTAIDVCVPRHFLIYLCNWENLTGNQYGAEMQGGAERDSARHEAVWFRWLSGAAPPLTRVM